jgi:predicted ATP-grasp superfamily ATP-dependent carboligase
VPVAVIDDEMSIARASRYVQHRRRVPDLHEPETALHELLAMKKDYELNGWVLYPTREETVALIAQRSEQLEGFRLPGPSPACVEVAWDKRKTYATAQRLGVPAPRCWTTWPHGAPAPTDEAAIEYPVVLKPAIKEHFFYATGAKAWRADSPDDLRRKLATATKVAGEGEIIVQELIPGDGQHQFAYCALFRGDRPAAEMTVRRWRQHPSDFGRASTFVETVDVPEIVESSRRFLSAQDYRGLVEIEYKYDARNRTYKLLDVNARTWGYHTLGAAAGVDFAYAHFRELTGSPMDGLRARPGVRWVRMLTDVPNAARDVWSRSSPLGPYLRSLRRVNTEAVFSLRDPLPGLLEVILLPYLAARRGL